MYKSLDEFELRPDQTKEIAALKRLNIDVSTLIAYLSHQDEKVSYMYVCVEV